MSPIKPFRDAIVFVRPAMYCSRKEEKREKRKRKERERKRNGRNKKRKYE